MNGVVRVDLANKSATVTAGDAHVGSWGPGVTRSNVEAVMGCRFAAGSKWTLTVDGGEREVVR